MRRRYKCLAIIAASCLLLQGCSNAIIYGEQDSVAIALKTQPNPNSPITGTIGVRLSVVAVVPPIKMNSSSADTAEVAELKALLSAVETGLTDMQTIHQGMHGGGSAAGGQPAQQEVSFVPRNGEAVSLISSFKFIKDKDNEYPIRIRTALITGQAAAGLDLREAGAAAAAIAGGAAPTGARRTVIRHVLTDLDAIAANSPQNRTVANLLSQVNALDREVPQSYPRDHWKINVVPPANVPDLIESFRKGTPISIGQSGLNLALTYWGKIEDSFDALNTAIENSTTVTFKGLPQTPVTTLGLIKLREETWSELERVGRAVGSDAAVLEALRYWVNMQE